MNLQPGIEKIKQAFQVSAEVPMKQYTRFKVGGPADLLAVPENRQELLTILAAAKNVSVPVTVVGGGSNLLVSDQGIRGLVVVTTHLTSGLRSENGPDNTILLSSDAGERLSAVCRYTAAHGLTGLEFCAGIPGTMGGAVMMNAGTASQGICKKIYCLDILDLETLAVKTVKKQDLVFTYRRLELTNHLILGAVLALTPGDPETVKKAFAANMKHKQNTQPMHLPSAGCFFKNPDPKFSAGKLIQDAGLKGASCGDARVSEIHANYIVNCGNATCKEILALKARIQKTVYDRYGIMLETEVQVTGNRGEKNE
ncbi:MAG: UDP-N-acetylmuramate dehydrogenase [Desulfotignum sp.]|jgi:UDP-N-acetylmuramate dehydrogenase|nr:UDP-N-acetylmuramate dehydrogenase [Desulfotignum sp.]